MTSGRPVEDRRGELQRLLADSAPRVVARAAGLVAAERIPTLAPDLVRAFARLLRQPAKKDPGCMAKTALADALQRLLPDVPAPEACASVFLPGTRHVQMEPVWGGQVDTAGDLRAMCLFGLVRAEHPGALGRLADALADPLPAVRVAAAKALAWRGRDDAVPLLRLRLGLEDEDPAASVATLEALLGLDPAEGVRRAAEALETEDEERYQSVALVLGDSRAEGAFEILVERWEYDVVHERRQALAAALAMLRRDEAFAFLRTELDALDGGAPEMERILRDVLDRFA